MKENMNLSLLQFANIFKTSKKEICICKVDQQLRKHCQRRKKIQNMKEPPFVNSVPPLSLSVQLKNIRLSPAILSFPRPPHAPEQHQARRPETVHPVDYLIRYNGSDIMVKGKTSKCSKTSKVQTFLCLEYLLRWHANMNLGEFGRTFNNNK